MAIGGQHLPATTYWRVTIRVRAWGGKLGLLISAAWGTKVHVSTSREWSLDYRGCTKGDVALILSESAERKGSKIGMNTFEIFWATICIILFREHPRRLVLCRIPCRERSVRWKKRNNQNNQKAMARDCLSRLPIIYAVLGGTSHTCR